MGEDAENSDDSDLQMIKMLTKEKAAKEKVESDLKRIEERNKNIEYGRDVDYQETDIDPSKKKRRRKDLDPETMAMRIALERGGIDLY